MGGTRRKRYYSIYRCLNTANIFTILARFTGKWSTRLSGTVTLGFVGFSQVVVLRFLVTLSGVDGNPFKYAT
jgi:hypothetical protein